MLRSQFFISKWGSPGNKKLIIHTTILGATYKGVDNIFLTSELLIAWGLDFEWRIAGITPDDVVIKLWLSYLKKKIRDFPVLFLGPLNTTELVNRLLEAHIYIHPSHIENSSNSICEAMLLGMPVIATYAGGTPDILKDKEEGILVQNGDHFHMAGAIIEMTRNHEKAIEFGKNARSRALIRHDPEHIVNQLVRTYHSVSGK
jgi:glycosyltransferase involved in cell wall biosynthesis